MAYVPGDWKALCDYCAKEYYASELKKDWQGFMACPLDFTTRNPQDFVRSRPETATIPWARPDTDILILPFFFTNFQSAPVQWTNNIGVPLTWTQQP